MDKKGIMSFQSFFAFIFLFMLAVVLLAKVWIPHAQIYEPEISEYDEASGWLVKIVGFIFIMILIVSFMSTALVERSYG